ncbi:MAG: hypothetical protein WBV06_00010 [Acidimicrobiia bacterium]
MKYRWALALAMAFLLLTACTGSGDTGPGSTDANADDTTTSSPASGSSVANDGDSATTASTVDESKHSGGEVGTNRATVTLDGDTYLFQLDEGGTCDPDWLGTGGLRALLTMVDENGDSVAFEEDSSITQGVDMFLADPGEGVPLSEISIFLEPAWWANPDAVEGSSVDSLTLDGGHAEGTAIFMTETGEGPVPGTFEVNCATQ